MLARHCLFRTFASRRRAWLCVLLGALPLYGKSALLPSSPDSYLSEATRLRRSNDRPWAPEKGQLGNLRHLQITARDCVVRLVSGSENRVFPGTRDVIVVEQSRVLDEDPNEQPVPRDVVLAPDRAQACPGAGGCGSVSITAAAQALRTDGTSPVCFTVQIATAHELLLGGDGLTLLADRLRQPALRISLNPSAHLHVWLEKVNLGLLSIGANAAARVGGTGEIDFLQAASSSRGSVMYLHTFHARRVGISTTTTGTQWSVRTGADTNAGYYQPARASGALAENYPIEIDGPLDRLDVPAGRVNAQPLSEAMRTAARALREEVLAHAGPTPNLPASDPTLPSATVAAAALPPDARERVAQVVARYLPASVRITNIALWKEGGRLEGVAPDADSANDVVRRLAGSGEFIRVSGGRALLRDGVYAFSAQLYFSCDAPGEPSVCPAADPAGSGTYSEEQVRDALRTLLGPGVPIRAVSLDGTAIRLEADAANESDARAALERIRNGTRFFRLSTSTTGSSANGSSAAIRATLTLTCAVPPKPDGICAAR